MSELADFRREAQAWLEENCPAGARGRGQVAWDSSNSGMVPSTAHILIIRVPTFGRCPSYRSASPVAHALIR